MIDPRPLPLAEIWPLDGLTLARLEEIDRAHRSPAPASWGRDIGGAWFVDVVRESGEVERFLGRTLHLAIRDALKSARRMA